MLASPAWPEGKTWKEPRAGARGGAGSPRFGGGARPTPATPSTQPRVTFVSGPKPAPAPEAASGGKPSAAGKPRNLIDVCTVGARDSPTVTFEIGRPLGRGAFGMVFLARETTTGFVCAIKRIRKRKVLSKGGQGLRNIQREIEIHTRLSRENHQHFVRFYNYFYDAKSIYMAMEYAIGGELKAALDKHVDAHGRGFSEPKVAVWMNQLASALEYMHGMNITHRDIKPENILIGAKGELKLTDFGWSVHSSTKRKTLCGTPDYMAPELIHARMGSRGGSHGSRLAGFDLSVDLWASGVLAFELLVGEAPFSWTAASANEKYLDDDDDDDDFQELFHRILRVDIQWPADISRYPRDFINGLLKKNPKKRTPVARWSGHPWFETQRRHRVRKEKRQKAKGDTSKTFGKVLPCHRQTRSQENVSVSGNMRRSVYNL